MMSNESMPEKCQSMMHHHHHCLKAAGLLALRIALAIIFIYSGYQKLFVGHEMVTGLFDKLGLAPAGFWAWVVGIVEFFGGIMILLGIFARYASVPLSIIMIVAMLTAHRGGPFSGYFLPLALLGGCLAILGAGAGRYRIVKTECHCRNCKNSMMMKDDMMMDKGGCEGGACMPGMEKDGMMKDGMMGMKKGCGCGGKCMCGMKKDGMMGMKDGMKQEMPAKKDMMGMKSDMMKDKMMKDGMMKDGKK
jgi:putative oxidoreductase